MDNGSLGGSGETAVKIRGLKKIYGKAAVIKGLDLDINRGIVHGLLGPNGAGKTTLMKIIAGLVKPTTGQIEIFGIDAADRPRELKRVVGLIPQDSNLEREFTVRQALFSYGRLFGVKSLDERVEEIAAAFNLAEMMEKKIKKLSGGMMRRVLIGRCLLPDPKLILLDEPTVGLDPDVRVAIWEIIDKLRAAGKTLIFTTHYMEEATRLCDHITMFRKGELILSLPKAELAAKIGGEPEDLEKLFIRLSREENG